MRNGARMIATIREGKGAGNAPLRWYHQVDDMELPACTNQRGSAQQQGAYLGIVEVVEQAVHQHAIERLHRPEREGGGVPHHHLQPALARRADVTGVPINAQIAGAGEKGAVSPWATTDVEHPGGWPQDYLSAKRCNFLGHER